MDTERPNVFETVDGLPVLPPECKYQTGDPDTDCVANLLGHAFFLVLNRKIDPTSTDRRSGRRAFKEECLRAKKWFEDAATSMGDAIPVAERTAFLKEGLAWVDAVAEWHRQDARKLLDMDAHDRLFDVLMSLLGQHKVLLGISTKRLERQTGRIRQAIRADEARLRQDLLDKASAEQKGKRGPARMPFKRAWSRIRLLKEWADVVDSNEALPKGKRVSQEKFLRGKNKTKVEFGRVQAWYRKYREPNPGGLPRDPRTVSRDDVKKLFA